MRGTLVRCIAAALLTMVCMTVSGCLISIDIDIGTDLCSIAAQSWQVRYYIAQEGSRPGYLARPGYMFVAVWLTVANRSDTSRDVDWSHDAVYLQTGSATYPNVLYDTYAVDRLPTYYPAHTSRSGFVFFEVPEWIYPSDAVLVVDFRGSDKVVVELSSIPQV